MKKFYLFFTAVALPAILMAQNINPSQNKIFRFNEVMRIELTMSESDKTDLIDMVDVQSREYFHATAKIRNTKIDTTVISDVGVRLRGNTSRDKFKKSIKIDFKEFGGEKFYNNKKFNLKAETNDPSFLREYISYHIMRNYGVPAPRTHFVDLHINGEYMGLYLNFEQIDDEFVDRRFEDNEAGNLYKCLYPATLNDVNDISNNNVYIIKNNSSINDRTRLINFVSELSEASPSDFESRIDPIFNIDGYLKQLAIEALIGHWDGYTKNSNNYYLYEDTATMKIHFIPYDLDNTWGIDWGFLDYENDVAADWAGGLWTETILTDKVLAVPAYYEQFCRHIVTVAENFFNDAYMIPMFDSLQKLLDPYIAADQYYTYDNGFSSSDFNAAADEAWGNHVWYSLKEYLNLRRTKFLSDLSAYASYGQWNPLIHLILW
jgi:spore coat protein H